MGFVNDLDLETLIKKVISPGKCPLALILDHRFTKPLHTSCSGAADDSPTRTHTA